jgi:CubicO group peptidase (beta-lactamase class C family)
MARQSPAWEPGMRQAYHAVSIGFYEGELLRRVDPQRRSLGQFFQEEIATPLELDFHIRVPEEIPNSRLAIIENATKVEMLLGSPIRLTLASLDRRSNTFRAVFTNPGVAIWRDKKHICARNLEVPAAGGVGTARAMARAYGVFATGGRELKLRAETLEALKAPAIPSAFGFYDEIMKGEIQFSLGYCKPGPSAPFGHPTSFGHPGAGGSFAFADPETGTGYAYVTNRMGTSLPFDPRDVALRTAVESGIG